MSTMMGDDLRAFRQCQTCGAVTMEMVSDYPVDSLHLIVCQPCLDRHAVVISEFREQHPDHTLVVARSFPSARQGRSRIP
jgi:hypothetical protein